MYQFELDGAGVVDRGVAALDVVEAVDVVADRQGGTGAALEVVDSFEFALEGREEALGDGIIPAISLPAHAGVDPIWWTPTLSQMSVEKVPYVEDGNEEAGPARAHARVQS